MKKMWVVGSVLGFVGLALNAVGAVLVQDTWSDGTRNDPAPPVYSEYGVDLDSDGILESAWFRGGQGTMQVVDTGGGTYVLRTVNQTTSSASWTTYFGRTTLNDIGNKLILTWQFIPYQICPSNASQGFRLAIFESANWLTADGTPANQDFYGYAIFQNFAPTLNRSTGDNLDIMERTTRTGDLLSSGANWTKRSGGGTQGTEGFVAGTLYTFTFEAERVSGGLQLTATISGGNINGTGVLQASFLDDTPDTYTFSGFCIRPSSSTSAAAQFDTTLFKVEFIPEPGVLALAAFGFVALATLYRKVK